MAITTGGVINQITQATTDSSGNVYVVGASTVSMSASSINATEGYVQSLAISGDDYPNLILNKSRSGTYANPGDSLGNLQFMSFDQESSYITATCYGTIASGQCPANLEFWTNANNLSGPQQRMVIDGNGAVTINNPGSGTGLTISGGGLASTGTTTLASLGAGAITSNSSGVLASNAGTSGQVLTSNGSGSAPTFQAAAVGGIVTLNAGSGSATGSTVTIAGTSNQITTTASSATLTISIPSSPSLTGTVTASTGFTATTGNITASTGNLVITAGNVTISSLSTAGVIVNNSSGVLSSTLTPTVTSITINNAPSATTDGVNKAYADSIAAGLDWKDTCLLATTGSDLGGTYSNGVSGVGATLTNSGTQVVFSLDGTSPSATSRILVKDQTSTYQNGIYLVTTVGSGSTNWVLTRSLDYDLPAQIAPGDIIPVSSGTLNGSTTWVQTATVTAIGSGNPITFTQFSYAPTSFLLKANNLSDVSSASTSRTNLGLTAVATQSVTQHGVIIGGASNALTSSAVGTNGQVLVGSSSADPSWVTPTAGTGLSVTANSTTHAYALSTPVSIANGGTGATTFTTDGIIYFDGTELASTAVGTATYVLTSNGTGMAPTFQPASGSSGVSSITGTANQITASASTGAVTLSIPSSPSLTGTVTASTGFTATAGGITITAGGLTVSAGGITSTGTTTLSSLTTQGVIVTNASGILSSSTAAISLWTAETGSSANLVSGQGFIADKSTLVTLTLPASSAVGDVISVVGQGTGLWKIAQGSGQQIVMGSATSTSGTGGSLASTLQYDCVDLVCLTASTLWVVKSSMGNITVT